MPTQEQIKRWRHNYYEKNKDKINAKRRVYEAKNKDKLRERYRVWYHSNIDKIRSYYSKERRHKYYIDCKERHLAQSKEYHENNRLLVLSHYSKTETPSCCWNGCDINDTDMLQLDHIDNNGSDHRKQLKTNKSIWRWVINSGFPEGFQVLCANHNMKKERIRYKK